MNDNKVQKCICIKRWCWWIGIGFIFLLLSLDPFGLICSKAEADTKKIEGTTNIDDAQICSQVASQKNNYGAQTYAYLGYDDATRTYRVLIRVKNVAAELGAGATISACVCSICVKTVYQAEDDWNLIASQVLKPWREGTQASANCADSGVTWNDWNCDDYEWTTAGVECANDDGVDNSEDDGTCDGSTKRDRKSTAESSILINKDDDNMWRAISVTAELAQAWYDGTANEEGIVLWTDATVDDSYLYFQTTENATEEEHPFWTFTYNQMVIRPNGDNGTNNWTPTPAGSHYATVDEETVDDDDYVFESTLNQKDEWDLEDVTGTIPSGSTIDSVLLTYRGKGSADFPYFDGYTVGFKLGANYTWGTEDFSADFTTHTEKLARPGGGDWSRDELDGLIIVAKATTIDGANGVWVSWAYATVYWTEEEAEAANKLLLKRQQRK